MKKRFLAALICAAMVFSLTGCRNGENDYDDYDDYEDNDDRDDRDDNDDRTGKDKNGSSKKPTGSKDVIDWDSVPYANEEDFEVVSMSYLDNFGMKELSDTLGISKYTGKEKIIKIPEVIDGKPVTALYGWDDCLFKGVSGLRIKTPGSLVEICRGFDSCDDLVLTLDTPKYYTGVKERPLSFFSDAFKNCKGVKVDMSMVGVGEFSKDAFSGSSGVNITFPQSIDSLSPLAFGEEIAPDNAIKFNGKTYDASSFGELYELANFSTEKIKTYRDIADITYLTAVSPKTSGTFYVPNNLWVIDDYAFMWCKDITNIVLHGNVSRVSENAFAGYNGNITYRGNTYPASEFNFEEARKVPEVKPLTDWDSVPYASESDFEYEIYGMFFDQFVGIKKYIGSSKKVKIPETIKGIKVDAFYGEREYSGVFHNTPDLEVMIPEGLTYLNNAFSLCSGSRVYLPESGERVVKGHVEAIFEGNVSIVFKGKVYDREHKDDFMSVYYGEQSANSEATAESKPEDGEPTESKPEESKPTESVSN